MPKPHERNKFVGNRGGPGAGAIADIPETFPGPTTEFVLKTANEATSTDETLSDDSELFFPVRANERWDVHLVIQYKAHADADIKFLLTAPGTGAAGTGVATRLITNAVDKEELFLDAIRDLTTSFPAGGIGTNDADIVVCDWWMNVLVGDADGNIQLQWAQRVSNAANTTVIAGSWISARKVS